MGAGGVDPVITGQVDLSVVEDGSIEILLEHLIVEDPDSNYPQGFTLSITKDQNHKVQGNVVFPDPGFTGTLAVPTKVNDGQGNSPNFSLSVLVIAGDQPPAITLNGPVEITVQQGDSYTDAGAAASDAEHGIQRPCLS